VAKRVLRLGTRGSKLARWQAEWTAAQLQQLGHDIELVEITTAGDVDQTHSLGEIGGLGLFTKEIQRALVDERVDFAVHSLKDLPTPPVPGLVLAAVPEREMPNDTLLSPLSDTIQGLPFGARVGTGSLRRRAQLLRHRPDLVMLDIRGNVDTRLKKLDAGDYDAVVLAAAGLKRLGLEGRMLLAIPLDEMLPAPGQGALGLECRADDSEVRDALAAINDAMTHAAVIAERTMLARVEGGCLAAIGAYAKIDDGELELTAIILSGDGTDALFSQSRGEINTAEELGLRVGDDLLAQGAAALVQERE
jgi:hydroxymethylbilane synthase